jgi:hypothetical protein
MTSTSFLIPAMTVTFNHIVDGQVVGEISWQLPGPTFMALFGQPSDGSTMLAQWITTAIYTAAVANGVITGTVTPDTLS